MKNFLELPELLREREAKKKGYLEFLRVASMSAGVYVLPAGGADPQTPHHEDELYYVIRGRARMKVGDEDRAVETGSVIFVAGEVEHRFYDVAEELVLLVFFAPPES
ncbi:MAG TPA: cupin domain-containing protein [Terriglobales bacterium]